MKKVTRLIIIALLVMFMLCSFSACGLGDGGDDLPEGTTRVRFMAWGGSEEKAAYQAVINQFETDHPNVKVAYEIVPSANYTTKLQTVLSSSKTETYPDLFYLPGGQVMRYVLAGKVEKLTPYLDKAVENDGFDMNNVWEESGWAPYRFNTSTLRRLNQEDDIWALPKDVGPYTMYYNKTIFNNAGISMSAATTWTWSEFRTKVKSLTSGAGVNKIYGVSNVDPEMVIGSSGAQYLSEDKRTLLIGSGDNNTKMTQSLQYLRDLIVDGSMPSSADLGGMNTAELFTSGRAAIYVNGPWAAYGFKNLGFEWDIMNTPKDDVTGKQSAPRGSMGLAVCSTSSKKDLAFDLAMYLAFGEIGQRQLYQSGWAVPNCVDMAMGEYLESSVMPASKSIYLDALKNDGGYTQGKPNEYTFDGEWYTTFTSGLSRVTSGTVTPEKYLSEKVPQMQSLLNNAWDKADLAHEQGGLQ